MSVTLHTDVGDIKIELFCEQCPKTCENFLALCASDYYNGCLFHRNIKGFIVQTGDPTGTGKGGSSIWGRKFEDEFVEELKVRYPYVLTSVTDLPNLPAMNSNNGGGGVKACRQQPAHCYPCEIQVLPPRVNYPQHDERGTVSMANNGPNTNASQFFFSYSEQPHLDLKYTLFGRVIDGLEALDDLEKMPVNPKTYRPLTEARITSVTIHANPLAG